MSRNAYTGQSDATTTASDDFDQLDDHSYGLPEIDLGSSARKPRRYASPVDDEEGEPDYDIDTSALERALPEFSPVQSLDDDDDDEDDRSVEVGRGTRKPARRLDDSRGSTMSFENSVRTSSPAVKLDYPSSSPPKSAVRSAASKRTAGAGDSLRKDAQLRRASQVHKEQQQTAKPTPRAPGHEQRRALSEMHERPDRAAAQHPRTTRFGGTSRAATISNQVAEAMERVSRELKEGRRAKAAANATVTTDTFPENTATATHQSFLLPDLPNLSELVSGVFEDGRPVFTTRQPRARTTRFVSPPHDAGDVSQTQDHVPVHAVPIPDDEKALFVSLRLLQDKVAELELAKSEAERKLEDARQENAALKNDRSHHHQREKERYDRRRMYSDDEEDYRRGGGRAASEKNRLEEANLSLQNRLDIADRKVQVHEAALKNLTRERDMAVSQLGVAYLNSQDLKTENENLKRENAELRAQLAKLTSLARGSAKKEDTSRSREQNQTERSEVDEEEDDDDDEEEDSRVYTRRTAESRGKAREPSASKSVDREISRLEKQRQEDALFSLDEAFPRRASTGAKATTAESRSRAAETAAAKKQPNTGKQRAKRVVVEEVSVSEPLNVNARRATDDGHDQTDMTLLSFIDGREIAQLRKTLEAERFARKQRQASSAKEPAANETVGSARRSSLKETTKTKLARPASATGEATSTGRVLADEAEDEASTPWRVEPDRRRRHSDHSVTAGRRRRRLAEEMTSAFILPDITFHRNLAGDEPVPLSESAQKALDNMAGHDGKNCMVCNRPIPGDGAHECRHITVPRPIPVSQRTPAPSIYNEDPTVRPSQPPAVALATVLKGLEDELAHLRMQLAACQSAYGRHDASASKRQRKSLHGRIERLLRDVDLKADQIYALYDVLEGQRQTGHEMTEREVEVTLQSIGLLRARFADPTESSSSKRNVVVDADDADGLDDDDDDDDDEEEEELPWEGIESTVDVTGRSAASRRDN
ncbi:hypothetical protein VTN02DRAFT_345 [Thermoascus thermophilus]